MILEKIIWKIREYRIRKRLGLCGENVEISNGCEIGEPSMMFIFSDVYIGPNSWIDARGKVTIKSGTILGPRVKVHSVNHRYENAISVPYDSVFIGKEVIINENVWIGADVAIMPGVIVGEGAVIAANSVVTKEIPPFWVCGGNPAKKN